MKKELNSAVKFLAIILCLAGLAMTANAQAKKKTTTRKTTPPAPTVNVNALELKGGAEKVSIQIKNVSKFIFILGGVAKDIEAVDADIRAKKITRPVTIDQNTKDRQAVVRAIQNLRAGLIALEGEFNTKPALRLYSVRVGGISTLVAQAETQAAGGKLTESGKTLLLVIERLSDALVALP
jgi:hypothetical protein